MTLLQLIQHPYTSAIASFIGGIIAAYLIQLILNKRGTFTYFVNHERIGLSANDTIFGSVAVSWNGRTVSNLYLSTVELTNESMNDYENVVIHTYTSDTLLLTEQTQIVGTPNILKWTENYNQQLHFEVGSSLSDNQWAIYNGQREYLVPIINRGQSVRLTYLNSAKGSAPNIWLTVLQKGVKLKFSVPQNQILGVSQPQAAFAGVIIGLAAIVSLVWLASNPWVIAFTSLIYGLIAQLPGAYAIKLLRKIKDIIGG